MKEAIKNLQGVSEKERYAELEKLFISEAKSKVQLRPHKGKPSTKLVEGVVREVYQWCSKVGKKLELKEGYLKIYLNTASALVYLHYGLEDPAITRMRHEVLRGKSPLEALTRKALDALTARTMASISKNFERPEEEK